WTGIAAAGLSGYLGNSSPSLSSEISYVTPWVGLAEKSIRGDKITPADWAGAVGNTLGQALVNNVPGASDDWLTGRLEAAALKVGTTALVAGALSHYDKNAAESYFDNNVGQEVGDFIGGGIRSWANQNLNQTSAVQMALAANSAAPVGQGLTQVGGQPYSGTAQATGGNAGGDTAGTGGAYSGSSSEGLMTFNTAGYTNTALDQLTLESLGGSGGEAPASAAGESGGAAPANTETAPAEPATFTVGAAGARGFWGIAQQRLGPDASNADIQNLALQLMTANPGVTTLHVGDTLNAPAGSVSAEAQQTYNSMDASYQTNLAQRREAAAEAAAAAQQQAAQEAAATQQQATTAPSAAPPSTPESAAAPAAPASAPAAAQPAATTWSVIGNFFS